MDLAFSKLAARSELSPARWRRPFLSWMDGIEAGWAIPLLLIGFTAGWLAFLIIAYLGGDLHSDVLETWTLGRSLEWGYAKHPPLMGWVAHAWTSVFPLTNWSFQLMAMTNATLALWSVDLISRRFVKGDKRVIVLLLLMMLPIYQLHAQRFNANAVLLATWPLASFCFLRSFETREIRWAIAAGAAGALAMLGKYYSVFLITSFVFAAICHPQRRAYFVSWAPWVSAIVMFTALLPHLHWLVENGAPPFAYALARHSGKALAPSVIEALLFILGIAMILAIPTVTWVLIAGNRLKKFSQDFRAMNPGLLLLFLVSVGTIVFPAITSVGLKTDMPPIWALQGLFLFATLIVCGTSYPIERFYSVNLAVLVIGMAMVAVVVAAPLHAYYRNFHPLHEGRNFYQQAVAELTRRWHEQSDAALTVVGGDEGLAFATAFYSPDHPVFDGRLVVPHSEALPHQATFERGWAALCYDGDTGCIASMEGIAARGARFVKAEFVVQSTLFGQPGASQGFTALMIPPFDTEKITPPPASPAPTIPAPSMAKAASEGPAVLVRQDVRQDEPTCCAPSPSPDSAESPSEVVPPPIMSTNVGWKARPACGFGDGEPAEMAGSGGNVGLARRLCALADTATGLHISRERRGVSACFARECVNCRPQLRGKTDIFDRGGGELSDRPGSKRTADPVPQPLQVRFKRKFCAMAADLDAGVRRSQENFAVTVGAARGRVDGQLQLWRKDSTPDPQRRGGRRNRDELVAVGTESNSGWFFALRPLARSCGRFRPS
jgi:4-amino-4-deoxy-L-arabinose transferase-like glycosyltransferase